MIDSVINLISPKWALERSRYRKAKEIIERRYEGAAKGRRTNSWIANGTDANKEVFSGLKLLRYRSRDLIRNNAYAVAAQSVVVTSVVGDGISGKASGSGDKKLAVLNDTFKKWSESKDADADGNYNFYGLQAMIEGSRFESGEVIIRRIYPKSGEYKYVPLKIQVLESDFLDVDKNETLKSGAKIKQGIQVSSKGIVEGYWLFDNHPGSGDTVVSAFYPRADVIHYAHRKRPGQLRAVPDLTPVMIPLRDLDEYEDAQLLKQKISACFAAFIKKDMPDGSEPEEEDDYDDIAHVEPGSVDRLRAGEDMVFANPPSAGDYDTVTKKALKKIATGLRITYEALTSDYSGSNFSQSRMAERVFNANIHNIRWNEFIPQVCNQVWDWFNEAAILEGLISETTEASWTPPKPKLLSPKEENEADITAIRGGLASWSGTVRERGDDPLKLANEIADDCKLFDELKLIFDSDPRKVMKAGIMQSPVAEGLSNGN